MNTKRIIRKSKPLPNHLKIRKRCIPQLKRWLNQTAQPIQQPKHITIQNMHNECVVLIPDTIPRLVIMMALIRAASIVTIRR